MFARMDSERQYLVYAMTYAAGDELAMLLPLPVQAGHGDDAVTFIDLHGYPDFFDDLSKAFEPPPDSLGIAVFSAGGGVRSRLQVHKVGDFEASYVPGLDDFDRLDPRFRLPEHLWQHLPRYADWGFAVFQLSATAMAERVTARARGDGRTKRRRRLPLSDVHPMALSFPTRQPDALFFPTVHVHDGEWREEAEFDHNLYCQFATEPTDWKWSHGALSEYCRVDAAGGIIDGDSPGYAFSLYDEYLPNTDIWVTGADTVLGASPDDMQMSLVSAPSTPTTPGPDLSAKQAREERDMIDRYGLSENPCTMRDCGQRALQGKTSCVSHTPIDVDIRLNNS